MKNELSYGNTEASFEDSSSWYAKEEEDGDEDEDGFFISEYDIISSPNDFNVSTIFHMIQSGVFEVPGFQRNYVWDIKRASKLIESLLIGLPVPQIFLYETGRNKFLVIDGQQRLMTIYYFMKGRFPRKEKRAELRQTFNQNNQIPQDILDDDKYFSAFKLTLPENLPDRKNKFNKLGYTELGEYEATLNLRTIRCIIIKQVSPDPEKDTAIYEIFNRLNTGGINLSQQEVRMSIYHSAFYEMLYRANTKPLWRKILGTPEVDLHMKDLEFLMKAFAMLIQGDSYTKPMTKFLNSFSRKTQEYKMERVQYLEELFDSFLASCSELLPEETFRVRGRFSVLHFEAIFAAVCSIPYKDNLLVTGKIQPDSLAALKKDTEFTRAMQGGTASKDRVLKRLQRARELIVVK